MAVPAVKQSRLPLSHSWLALLPALLLLVPLAHTARAAGSWRDGGDMHTARTQHTATLLASGKLLVAGGRDSRTDLASAELFDPTTGSWEVTGDMNTARRGHTATLLPGGTVLVAGGFTFVPGGPQATILASAELYDPITGNWTPTGSMSTARSNPTATLLASGNVLVVGGYTKTRGADEILASAELYDPVTGNWTPTRGLNTGRSSHTSTLLPDGRVLVAGGYHGGFLTPGVLDSAELYDPATGIWTATGSMGTARERHTATLLPNGQVLVAGGYHAAATDSLASAEIYDAASGTWTATGSLSRVLAGHTATLLPTGKVLVAAGGDRYFAASVTATEQYDPTTGSWADAGASSAVRFNATATLLIDGEVMVAGGDNGGIYYASTELYDPTITSAAPVITAQPVDKLVRVAYSSLLGLESSFSAVASGNPTPTVQWQVSTDGGATFTNIDGASSSTYQFVPDLSQRGNRYRAVFTNSSGKATSNAASLTFTCFGMVRRASIGDPTVGAITTSTPTFEWGGGSCVRQYYLFIGSSYRGNDLYNSGPLARTVSSATVSPAIPLDGRSIYVRLWSLVNDSWQLVDHSYTAGMCQNPPKADISSSRAHQ